MKKYNKDLVAKYGLSGEISAVYNRKSEDEKRQLIEAVMDSALQTNPNIGVPVALATYVDSNVTSVLYNPRSATEVFSEQKIGDWTTDNLTFKVRETTGKIAPYGDFSPNGRSGVNYNFPNRQHARFQTIIEIGDLSSEMAALAKLNEIADKQLSAAETIAIAQNYFYLYGVEGLEIYGLLNDPNLNPAIAAANTGSGSSTKWKDKTTNQIYNDILALFGELVKQNKNIHQGMDGITLVVPPSRNVELGKATEYNVSVQDMLAKYFKSLKIVVMPELEKDNNDASMFLTVREVKNEQVAVAAFAEKYKLSRVVQDLTSFKQKAMFSTYGTVVKHPSCIATMTGI